MAVLRYLSGVLALACALVPAEAQAAHTPAVRSVAVVNQTPLQLQIQTSAAVVPQSQVISGPERLVIDIPNAVPGATLRGIAVNRGAVKRVRVSLFSTTPPVTRIVVDLNAPQWYRIAPNPAGLLVSLGNDSEGAANAPTIGWVSAKLPVKVTSAQVSPLMVREDLPQPASRPNGVSVQFANGLLSIHAKGATLSEVLFQVQKQTGAEIAIPSGTEQDRVAADFGPGLPGEVLGELLTGSGLNFVVVGSEADPKVLRSVILSRKVGGPDGPTDFAQAYAPPAAENIPPENQEVLTPPDDSTAPPQPIQPPADPSSPAPPPPQ